MKNYTKIRVPKKYHEAINTISQSVIGSGQWVYTIYGIVLNDGFKSGNTRGMVYKSFNKQKEIIEFITNIQSEN